MKNVNSVILFFILPVLWFQQPQELAAVQKLQK